MFVQYPQNLILKNLAIGYQFVKAHLVHHQLIEQIQPALFLVFVVKCGKNRPNFLLDNVFQWFDYFHLNR